MKVNFKNERRFPLLRRVLEENEIAQADLALAAGVSHGHLSAYLNGYQNFGPRARARVARALGQPVEDLFPETKGDAA